MLDVTVKTLDGTNRSFSVPDDITVKQFKEKIAGSISITAETQRLIFQGRVLQDEKKLNEYDVNGKTLHVVQRAPPSSRSQTPSSTGGSTSTSAGDGGRDTRTFVGSFTLPSDVVDPHQVQNIVSQVLSGMGDVARNARITTRSAGDGSSVDVHINLGNISGAPVQSESQNRIRIAQRMIRVARHALDHLENPSSTESEESESMDITPSDEASPERDAPVAAEGTPSPSSREPSVMEESAETAEEGGTTEDETATAEGGATAQGTSSSNGSGQSQNGNQNRTAPNPRIGVLGEVLGQVFELNQRLQPHLERYQQFTQNDPDLDGNSEDAESFQRLSSRVSEVLHCISHAYHSLSDLMIDPRQAPPRLLRASPVAYPAAVIQQTIPVQAQINVAHVSPRASPQLPRRSGTTTSTASSSTSSSSTTTTSSSQQQQQQQQQPGPQMQWPGAFGQRFPMPGGAQIHMGGPPRMAGAAAFGPNGQPLMFMEVGPQGIAINSISTQVISEPNTTRTTSNTTSATGSTPSTTTSSSRSDGPPPAQGIPGMGGPGAPFLPPNFLQNIVQMAQQAAMGGQAGQQVFVLTQSGAMPTPPPGATSTQARTTSGTTTTTATSTQPSTQASSNAATSTSSQTGAPPGGQTGRPRFMFQGAPPPPGFMPPPQMMPQMMPGMGRQHSLDPYLPCQSRFFLRRRVAAAAAAATPGEAQRNQQDQDLQNTLSNMVSSALGSVSGLSGATNPQSATGTPATSQGARSTPLSVPHPQAPPAHPFAALFNPATFQAGSPSAPAPTTVTPGARSTGASNSGTETPAIVQLRNLLQSSTPSTSTASGSSQSETRSSGTQPMGDEMFAQMVQGIGNYVSQAATGQQTSDSIYDFISALGQETESTEGLLSDIFACVSRHLTIIDLMAVFCQQTAPLQRLVGPLQEFVRTRVLQSAEATDDNLESALDRLVEETLPRIEEICVDTRVRENIDFTASVQELLRHHLRVNAQLILAARESDPSFGTSLYNNIRQLIHEFLVLGRCCLEGGTQAVQALVQANVQRISSDVNPMIQQWMSNMSVQQLQTTLRTITVTEEQVQRYIVHQADRVKPGQSSPQSQSSEASFMSAESGDKEPAGATGHPRVTEVMSGVNSVDSEGMEVDSIPSPPRNRADRHPMIDPVLLECLPPPPQRPEEVPVVVGSESWHSQVPSDWIPVITNDLHTQRRQAPQRPLSDAYINSMPAKRRKIMGKSGDNSEMSNLRTLIPQAIEKAAKAAGAEPVTSPEDMTKDASGSTTLQEAFRHEMDESIRRRIENDPDYIAEKFPDVEKYYKKKE